MPPLDLDALRLMVWTTDINTLRNNTLTLLDELAEARRTLQWQRIETAPKGGGTELTTDPAWVEPPRIWAWYPETKRQEIVYWDWYYAEGGGGYEPNHLAWVIETQDGITSSEIPTHWMPLPALPAPPED